MDWDKGSKDADATGERICESVGRCACESSSSFVGVEQERIGKVRYGKRRWGTTCEAAAAR